MFYNHRFSGCYEIITIIFSYIYRLIKMRRQYFLALLLLLMMKTYECIPTNTEVLENVEIVNG